jgi:hypothetical protein
LLAALLLGVTPLAAQGFEAVPAHSFGFFPSAPEMTTQSVLANYDALGKHADVVLLQRSVPWKDFAAGVNAAGDMEDLAGLVKLGRANGLEPILVVDPLNGVDRRRFYGLPDGWAASFANPDIRAVPSR